MCGTHGSTFIVMALLLYSAISATYSSPMTMSAIYSLPITMNGTHSSTMAKAEHIADCDYKRYIQLDFDHKLYITRANCYRKVREKVLILIQ